MSIKVHRYQYIEVEDGKFKIGDTVEFISTDGDVCEVVAVDCTDTVTKFVFLNSFINMITPDFFPPYLRKHLVKMPFGYFRFPYQTEICSDNYGLDIDKRAWGIFGSLSESNFVSRYFDDEVWLNETVKDLNQRYVSRWFDDVYLVPNEGHCRIKPVFYLKRE